MGFFLAVHMEVFTRRQIVMMRDSLHEVLYNEQDMVDIADLLEVPRNWVLGNNEDSSPYARLKTLLENLNDNPETLLELINMLIRRDDFYMSKNFVSLVRSAGLDVIGDQKSHQVVFATPGMPQKKEAIVQAQTAAPKAAAGYLDQAREALARADPKASLGRCRDALESFGRPFAPQYLKSLEDKGTLSSRDKAIFENLWGYLSEFGAHANSPTPEQGELGLNMTESCIIFLTRKLK